jgi:hypothetical protein
MSVRNWKAVVADMVTQIAARGRFRLLPKDKTGHSPNKRVDVRFLFFSGLFDPVARTSAKAENPAIPLPSKQLDRDGTSRTG